MDHVNDEKRKCVIEFITNSTANSSLKEQWAKVEKEVNEHPVYFEECIDYFNDHSVYV